MSIVGKTLGHYKIGDQPLGKGGMGEVYRAKDLKLGREVAIKVLPEEFARDADRVARFQREAKLLASLNHPNIAAIYGLEESGGTQFLVLELVEGETLADQLKRGPIPVEESLKLALQIAEALEAAHEKGVIHRDLKPANIKLTPEGKVKVLDFGLAKAFAGEQADLNLSNSPTLSNAATQQGVILGTAAYMSPEQARGETVDKRADIWAFGCVLFEMVTGRGMFEGRTVSDTLAAVLMREPEWKRLPPNLHPRIRLLLERCLEKEAKNRCSGMGDARADIQKALADPSGVLVQPITTVEPRKRLRTMLPWIAAILGIIIVGVGIWNLRKPEPHQVVRFDYELPKDQQFGDLSKNLLAISPDGNKFVYCTRNGLYLRFMNQPTAILIAGSDKNSLQPFFSPNGQWIGYWSGTDNQLKKIAIGGGTPVPLADAAVHLGATWGIDDTIVYGELGRGIMRVSANGGAPELLIDIKGQPDFAPQFLPDGKSVLVSEYRSEGNRILVQSLKSLKRKVLIEGDSAQYLPTGHLVYMVRNNLFAIPFDVGRLEAAGGQVPVVEGVLRSGQNDATQYAVSDSGTLIYVPGTASATASGRTLVWVNRDGKEESLAAGPNDYNNPRISPDGTKVVLSIVGAGAGARDIWIWDLVRKTMTRLTFDSVMVGSPLWTPNGKRIAFFSTRENKNGVWWKSADGTGKEELVVNMTGVAAFPASWSDDGKTMILADWDLGRMGFDIGMMSMEGNRNPRSLLKEKYHEAQPQISPDRRLMAYTSNESGQNQIYVRPFPEVEGGRWQISTSGGDSPLWSPDGRELFYRNGEAVMAVAVKTGPSFGTETPRVLFRGTYVSAVFRFGNFDFATWDISPDGKRFLMMKEPGTTASADGGPRKINIVLNWFEELKQRVPMK